MQPYYQDELVTLYHGDCLGLIGSLIGPAVMVTDPPYGVNYQSGWDNQFRDVPIVNDADVSVRDKAIQSWGDRPALVFGSWKQPRPKATKAVLIWDKGTVGMGDLTIPWFPCTEEIYVLGEGWEGSRTSAVMRHVQRNRLHPTEKPEGLLLELIGKCPRGAILDPFCGSGTTLLAAKRVGRQAYGIEIQEQYCRIAAERLSQGSLAAMFTPAWEWVYCQRCRHTVQLDKATPTEGATGYLCEGCAA